MMMSWNLHPLFLREGDLLACASQSLQEHLQMCIIGAVACLLPIRFLALCTWVVLVEADCSSQLPQAMAGIGLLEQAGSYLSQKLDDERDYHPRSKINIEDFTIINKSLSLEANLPPSWEGRTC